MPRRVILLSYPKHPEARLKPPRLFIAALLIGATLSPTAQAARRAPANPDIEYPKPDPARAFAGVKVYAKDGSPLRHATEDWDNARKRVANDVAWQKWLAAQRADTDDWMQKRRDHKEWICGWFHDFVSPVDGSHLTWTPDEPGEYTLHSASDPRVKLTPKLRAAWVYSFRTSHAQHILNAAMLYRLMGDKRYADWVAGQLDFYADNYVTWPKQSDRPGIHFMWQSLDEAVDLIKYVGAARTLGDYVTPERKQHWFTALFQPECALLDANMHSIHNIACWHRAAMGCTALYYDDETLWQAAVDSPFGIRNQLAQGVTSDYLWQEQSLGYNSYVVSALLPFFEAASMQGAATKLAGEATKLAREMEIAENLMLSPLLMRFPTDQLPSPADGARQGKALNVALLADTARIFPTSFGLAAQQTRRDWSALVDPLSAPATTPTLPPVTSFNMESSRMAILRQGAWQVYLHYGQLTHSHAQAEALNYEAFYNQTDVTHDPGTVGYGSLLHRDFYSQGLAHNVPLIDGQGQEGWSPGKLLAFAPGTTDAPAHVAASQPTYRKNAGVERELMISGNQLTDTVKVATTDGQPHELGLLVQLQGQAKLPPAFQPDNTMQNAPHPAGFAYWKDVTSAPFTDNATFTVAYPDGQNLQVSFTLPGNFIVTHASAPDAPPYRREVFFIHTKGTNAVFKTVFGPG